MRTKLHQVLKNSTEIEQPENFALVLYRLADGSGDKAETWADDLVFNGNVILERQTALLAALAMRQQATMDHWKSRGHCVTSPVATVDWRLVIGVSYGRVWDIGSLQVHPLYGIPWLPPSAVKGILHHYATAEEKPKKEEIDAIFGHEDHKGDLRVFDAFCLESESKKYFDVDLLNKHYGPYYKDPEGKAPPADWYEPVPLHFPAITQGVRFTFHFAAKKQATLDSVSAWLKDALEWRGVGAKTRVGYGRMEVK